MLLVPGLPRLVEVVLDRRAASSQRLLDRLLPSIVYPHASKNGPNVSHLFGMKIGGPVVREHLEDIEPPEIPWAQVHLSATVLSIGMDPSVS